MEIWVHHGMPYPVIFKPINESKNIMHVQCIAGIHFNPVTSRRRKGELSSLIRNKNINSVRNHDEIINFDPCSDDNDDHSSDDDGIVLTQPAVTHCNHDSISPACVINFSGINVCALLDSGAEVNVVSRSVIDAIKNSNGDLAMESDSSPLQGIVKGERSNVNDAVMLSSKIDFIDFEERPFGRF